jgi:hypothetical protein
MVEQAKTWLKDNSTLVYFLLAQAVGIGAAVLSMTAYMVKLEARVQTLETRGSPHLAVVDNRLTVLESTSNENKRRLDNVINIMTKELHISPAR